MRTDEEIAYFLSFSTNQTSFSTAGMAAARFIEKVWGLHNANVNLSKINFAHPENIRFSLTTGGLATVDYNELTRMVVIAHDMVLRLEIQPASPRQLRVILSLRQRESKRFWEMCPTIEEHIATIRK